MTIKKLKSYFCISKCWRPNVLYSSQVEGVAGVPHGSGENTRPIGGVSVRGDSGR